MNIAYFDGACQPINPGGNMGIGVFIQLDNGHNHHISYCIFASEFETQTSNNIAEYLALNSALEYFIEHKMQDLPIGIIGDSQLVIKQMIGEYGANSGLYIPHYRRAQELAEQFANLSFRWVPREQNAIADGLSTKSLVNAGTIITDFAKFKKR